MEAPRVSKTGDGVAKHKPKSLSILQMVNQELNRKRQVQYGLTGMKFKVDRGPV
jgi:hypothetical protein